MKKIISACFLLLVLSMPIYSQTIEQTLTTVLAKPTSVQEKIYVVHDLLQTASDKRTTLRAEGAQGKTRLDDVNSQTAHYDAVVATHNTAVENLEGRFKSQNNRADVHNSNRCVYYNGRTQDCAAYDAEQDSINAEGANLDREKTILDNEKNTIDAAGAGLQLIIDDYNKWKDDFNARNTTNEHNIDVLMRVLDMLQKTNSQCQQALQDPNSTPEHVSAACGQGFDGNTNDVPLTRTGTGGASRN